MGRGAGAMLGGKKEKPLPECREGLALSSGRLDRLRSWHKSLTKELSINNFVFSVV